MNFFDEAGAISGMIQMKKASQSEIAKMLGVSQSYVANKLRLLGLDEELRKKIIDEGLSERHARALLKLDKNLRPEALDRICERRLNVRESDALIDMMRTKDLANTIGKSDRLSAIDVFLTGVKDSLSSLSSLGVGATQKLSYHGSKIMLTISLDEDQNR